MNNTNGIKLYRDTFKKINLYFSNKVIIISGSRLILEYFNFIAKIYICSFKQLMLGLYTIVFINK